MHASSPFHKKMIHNNANWVVGERLMEVVAVLSTVQAIPAFCVIAPGLVRPGSRFGLRLNVASTLSPP